MASITRRWRRFLAVGCSHGHYADKALLKELLAFKQRWAPQQVIHLGDAVDLACFRTGALSAKDEATDPTADIESGLGFLSELEPTLYFFGNHEDRLTKLMQHPRAIVACLAHRIHSQIVSRVGCEIVPYNFQTGWRQIGDALFGHGYMHNESSVRDHAEAVCGGDANKAVIAHLHRVSQAEGRNRNHPTGYCVGWLGDTQKAEYAVNRRATTSWSRGFAWGEFCDNETVIWLAKETRTGKFRLPL